MHQSPEQQGIPELWPTAESLLPVLENTSDGFYIVNRSWKITYASVRTEALFDLKQEDVGRVLWERFPDAVGSRFYHEYHRAFADNTSLSFEAFSSRANCWCQVTAFPYRDHLFIFIKDVSGRIQQEKRLSSMAKASLEVIWERPLHSADFHMNTDRFNQLFGYRLAPGVAHQQSVWRDNVHPEDWQKVQENCSYALRHGFEVYLNEYRFRRADGSWAYIKDRTYVVRDEKNQPVALMGAMEDISRERLAEQALQEREISYRELFQHSPFPTWVFDTATHRFLDVNKAALDLYGYTKQDVLRMTVFDLRPPSEHPRVKEALQQMGSAGPCAAGTFIHLKKNGEQLLVDVSLSTTRFKGKPAGMAMIRDVTEQRRLEQELLHAEIRQQKSILKAVIEAQEAQRSEIARELHDNVNQILTAAKLSVENINVFPEQREPFVQKGTALIQLAVHEIRSLSQRLATPEIPSLGLRNALHELLETYRELCTFDLQFTFQAPEQAIESGLQLTLYRIVQELLNNAVKYAKASVVCVNLDATDNEVLLCYMDDGVGFDPATVVCGQGMKNMKNRAEAYLGRVSLQTAAGAGCVVVVSFPLKS